MNLMTNWYNSAILICLLSLFQTSWAQDIQVYGGYTAGCIPHSPSLTKDGTGYHVIRLQRQRYYGHPSLINYIQQLGKQMQQQQLGDLLIADMAQQHGGPMPSGHRSHQIGLDVDILLDIWQSDAALDDATRTELHPVSMLSSDKQAINLQRWQTNQAKMIKLAAQAQQVQRIFIHPRLKQQLCQRYPQASWLKKIRPWWGHEGHFHVRLRCPDNSPACKAQQPITQGRACGQSLNAWLTDLARPPSNKKTVKKKRKKTILPDICQPFKP